MKKECKNCILVLGNKSRFKLFEDLAKNPQGNSVGFLVNKHKLGQSIISYHLLSMRKSGLLRNTKTGRKSIYTINKICPFDKLNCFLHQ